MKCTRSVTFGAVNSRTMFQPSRKPHVIPSQWFGVRRLRSREMYHSHMPVHSEATAKTPHIAMQLKRIFVFIWGKYDVSPYRVGLQLTHSSIYGSRPCRYLPHRKNSSCQPLPHRYAVPRNRSDLPIMDRLTFPAPKTHLDTHPNWSVLSISGTCFKVETGDPKILLAPRFEDTVGYPFCLLIPSPLF